MRKRKRGEVEIHDPDASAKKPDRAGLHPGRADGVGRVGHGRSRPVPGYSSARHPLAARRSACSLPHEYVRHGTAKLITLFHPATGQVRVKGVTSCPNVVLHAWLEAELLAILEALPPARVLDEADNWAGLRAGGQV